MLVTLLLTRLDIVKNSYCYQGGSSIMQALQISHLNINPLITQLCSPPPAPNQLPSGGSECKPGNYCPIISENYVCVCFVLFWFLLFLFFFFCSLNYMY